MVGNYPGRTVDDYIEMQKSIDLGQAIVREILLPELLEDGRRSLEAKATRDLDATVMVSMTKRIHRVVFKSAFGVDAGRFRIAGQDVEVGHNLHTFQGEPHDRIEAGMVEVWSVHAPVSLARIGDRQSVATWAARFCQAFFRVHPFRDGNGRTARLLVEMIAAIRGLVIEWPTFTSRGSQTQDRTDYLEALQYAHKHLGLTKAGAAVAGPRNPFIPLSRWWETRIRTADAASGVAPEEEGEGWQAGTPDEELDAQLDAILATVDDLRRGAALKKEVRALRLPYEPPPPKKRVKHAETLKKRRP
jgi:fido (protein-threonine AMPylation protein)